MPGPVDVLQGTTPTLLIPIAGEDWTQCTVYLAIEMRGKVINRKILEKHSINILY